MLPKGTTILREAGQSPSAYDSPPLKNKTSSKKQIRCKENAPPSDPNCMGSDQKVSPATAAKAKCSLPPRPPSSNPLKRKLNMEAAIDNAAAGVSDSGVKVYASLLAR